MPIRHCQKCGLKVLIDESQTTANPFYCQRCAATAKAGGGSAAKMADPIPMVSKRESAPVPAPPPAATSAMKGSGGPVKVLCPYCKASFSGRLPAKPAKGACPVCQKELVLLPDGKIKPAATFDLAKWQKEMDLQKVGGDPGVAEQARAVQKALERARPSVDEAPPTLAPIESEPVADATLRMPEPEPDPVPEPSIIAPPRPSGGDPLGGLVSETMLDMGRPSELDELVKAAAPRKTQPREQDDPLAVLGNEEPMGAPPAPPDEAVTAKQPRMKRGDGDSPSSRETAPVEPLPSESEPQPEPSPEPAPAAAAGRPGMRAPAEPAARPASALIPKPKTGKVVVGGFFMLLPVIAGIVCLFLKDNAQLNNLLAKVSTIAQQGLRRVHDKLTEKPAPRKKVEKPEKKPDVPPDPPPSPPPPDKGAMEREMTDKWQAMLLHKRAIKSLDKDPTENQKRVMATHQEKHDKAKARFDELQADYKKHFGTEFKPADE